MICRFIYDNVTVDIMPDDEKVIGFSNPWYRPGLLKLQSYKLTDGPARNHGTSHDFEDIIYLTDNAATVVNQIKDADADVKDYLKKEYRSVWENSNRTEIISCHLQPLIRTARLKVIEAKVAQIIES